MEKMTSAQKPVETEPKREPAWQSALRHSFSGFVAATFATLVTYPLDFVKVRYMAQDGTESRACDGVRRYGGVSDAIKRCYRGGGGGLGHMYSGMSAALYASAASWGIYFGLYRFLQLQWRLQLLGDAAEKGSRSAGGRGDFISATTAGLATTSLVNPLWLVKTRMQLQVGGYSSLRHGLVTIIREEGVRGLYNGLGPGLLLVSHGALQMAIYERLRAAAGSDGLGSLQVALCTITAKCAAASITTPLSVVRTRMQDPRNRLPSVEVKYTSTFQAGRTVVAREGIRGLWRGLVPGLVRTVPHAVVTFVGYEAIAASPLLAQKH
eukprot:Hpha_TRINITY_DN18435_c0_g1::TRINITY_DN18435_c0_g1_i1::g.165363::m.165363/K15115/SLC25A32, MFT; solute carrier family 25 (mitochondrial folate transporter), member 32